MTGSILRNRSLFAADTFDFAIVTEVLEHITRGPMHTLSEINRVTRIGGWIMLSTPNCNSLRSVFNVIRGNHPQIWSQYSSQAHRDRHNREYTPKEVAELLTSAGYKIHELRTANDAYNSAPRPLKVRAARWVANCGLALLSLLAGSYVPPSYRGEATFVTAQKIGPVSKRFPSFLYGDF
jgi:SAM-dependent methyltransferase